ncbi:MAG: hypothetical protein ACRDY7_12680 [Acidimicrobiia bacterium]
MLVARLAASAALQSLALWWVLVPHRFDGAVMAALTETHGVHSTDWPAVLFVAAGFLLVRRSTGQRITAPAPADD